MHSQGLSHGCSHFEVDVNNNNCDRDEDCFGPDIVYHLAIDNTNLFLYYLYTVLQYIYSIHIISENRN